MVMHRLPQHSPIVFWGYYYKRSLCPCLRIAYCPLSSAATIINGLSAVLAYCLLAIAYSLLKLSTGFPTAAFTAWKAIVTNAITTATIAATTNTHHSILILYEKSCNHRWVAYHASGVAMIMPTTTNAIKSRDNKETILVILAPSILRMPISFVR
jgi:hypothetical protein